MLFHDGSSYHLETSPLICGARIGNEDKHCVESVQILSFFWSLFSRIRTEYGKNAPYLSVFSPNAGKYGPEKTPYLDSFHTANISVNNFILKRLVTINFNRFCCLFRGFVLILVIFYLNKNGRRRICHFDYKSEVFPHV